MADGSRYEFSIEEQLEQNTRSLRELSSSMVSFNGSFKDETTRHFDELNSKMDLMMQMLRGLSNDIRKLTSPSDYGSEFSTMDLQPDSSIGDVQQVEASRCTTAFEFTMKRQVDEDPNSPSTTESPVVEVFAETSCDEGSQPNVQQIEVQQVETSISAISYANIMKEQVRTQSMKLPFVDLKSILSSGYEATVNGSINGSTKAWFGEVTSIMEVGLGKNVMEDDAYKVFDKMSELTSMKQNDKIDGLEELVSSVVRLPRVLGCGSEVTEFQALCANRVWNLSALGVKLSNLEEMIDCKSLLSHLNNAQSSTTHKDTHRVQGTVCHFAQALTERITHELNAYLNLNMSRYKVTKDVRQTQICLVLMTIAQMTLRLLTTLGSTSHMTLKAYQPVKREVDCGDVPTYLKTHEPIDNHEMMNLIKCSEGKEHANLQNMTHCPSHCYYMDISSSTLFWGDSNENSGTLHLVSLEHILLRMVPYNDVVIQMLECLVNVVRTSLLSTLLENFVWDPGQDIILLYILEDKDFLRGWERI